ncbi:MAG: hypothetical protein KDK99_06465, partial [Verrucomicrobiales bacterium]|nr:hypothetical protein [Verrucomicrobiales bacterium]
VATICCLAVLEMILDIWDSRLALAALQDGAKAGAGHWLLPQVNAAKFIVAFITTGALGLLELTDAPHPSLGGYLQSLFGLALVIGMLTGLSSFFFPDAGGLLRQSGLSITLVTVLVLPLWIWQPDRRWTH